MTRSSTLAIVSLGLGLSLATAAQAQSSFEGTVTLALLTPADSVQSQSTINLKGDKMEIEIDAGVQGIIKLYPDSKKHTMHIALMAMKQGREVPLPPESVSDVKIDLKPNGKKQTVSGHAAEGYTLSIPQADFVLWATSELPENVRVAYGNALPHMMQEDGNLIAAFHQLAAKKMVPIKIEIAPKGAPDQNAAIEFVKAEPKKLDGSLFELPKEITFAPLPPPGGERPPGAEGAAH